MKNDLRAHIRRYFDVYYDALPDHSYVVAVIDRRPQEPPPERTAGRTPREVARNRKLERVAYGAPPFFMRADPVTQQWDFWNDEPDGAERILNRIRRGDVLSEDELFYRPDAGRVHVPPWVRGVEL